MSKRVVISGLGPVSGLGIGIEPTWQELTAGHSAVSTIQGFDPSGFPVHIGAEVKDFKVRQFVPKSYRKAIKVMARDIQLAVVAAALAADDANLVTASTINDDKPTPSYTPGQMGAHIGAGLLACELDELTTALVEATDDQGRFDYHRWGGEGITHMTPLWLLKYLPNMLACHVTIIHDAQGPSNTITCAEASGALSIGESLRVIQRGAADMCFSGGMASKLNPLAFIRQLMTGRLNASDNDQPHRAVRPFCQTAAGTAVGEGGGIVILESLATFQDRADSRQVYAQVAGFGASQTVNRASRNLKPDPEGRSIALAIRSAMREASVNPEQIDLIVPFGIGVPDYDQAEAAALKSVFASNLERTPIVSTVPYVGNCEAGSSGLAVCVAAKAIAQQVIPASINCDQPLDGLNARSTPSRAAKLNYVLVYSTGLGGQNAALILKRFSE